MVNELIGGGTNFPLLDALEDHSWCQFIDCDQPYDAWLAFRPIEGNVEGFGVTALHCNLVFYPLEAALGIHCLS